MVTDEIVQFESDRYNVPPVNNFLDNQQVLEIVEKNTLTLNFTICLINIMKEESDRENTKMVKLACVICLKHFPVQRK